MQALVINTDLTDPAPKAAFEWAFNKFQEENPDVTIEVNNFDHEGYKQAIKIFNHKSTDVLTGTQETECYLL